MILVLNNIKARILIFSKNNIISKIYRIYTNKAALKKKINIKEIDLLEMISNLGIKQLIQVI